MSNDEEDDVIYIMEGQSEKTFSVREANNPAIVRQRFQLEDEPQHVLTKMGKEINFGKLKNGMTYKLHMLPTFFEGQKIHQKNAAALSASIYKEHPETYLQNQSQCHTIRKICDITKYSQQKIMFAVGEVEKKNVLYVTFRGSHSWDDFLADFDMKLEEVNAGKVHAGFLKRSKTVPIEYIMECAEAKNCQSIVTCGHSLGGAVSAIVGLDLMKNYEIPVYCITFGVPLFANSTFAEQIREYEDHIINHVKCTDIVPGLLSLENTSAALKNKKIDCNSGLGSLLLQYHTEAAKVLRIILDNVDLGLTNEEVGIFTELCKSVINGFEETDLGREYKDDEFVPIGNYMLHGEKNPSVLDRKSLSQQIIELVLKNPIQKLKTIAEIKEGHSIKSYCEHFSTPLKESSNVSSTQFESESFFKPQIQDKASVLWSKQDDGKWKCQMAVRGNFLRCLQLGSPQNKFSGLPFKSSSKFVVDPGDRNEALFLVDDTENNEGMISDKALQIEVVTTFGIVPFLIKDIHQSTIAENLANISVEESVMTILTKSYLRMLAISHIEPGEGAAHDGLRYLIEKLVDRLRIEHEHKTIHNDLIANRTNPLQQENEIQTVTEQVIKKLTKKIEIRYIEQDAFNNKKTYNLKKKIDVDQESKLLSWWEKLGFFFSWYLGRGAEIVEENYVEQLKAVYYELYKNSSILKMDAEKKELHYLIISGENEDRKAYFLEKILMSFYKDREEMEKVEGSCKNLWSEVIFRLLTLFGKNSNLADEVTELLENKYENPDTFLEGVDELTLDKLQHSKEPLKERIFGAQGEFTDRVKVYLVSEPVISSIKNVINGVLATREHTEKHDLDPLFANESDFPKQSTQIFKHLHKESIEDLNYKLDLFKNMHDIRELYGRQCYIGFIGPQNSGKSTLLNELWGTKAETGMRTHTLEPTKYKVSDDIFAIDFPGSNALEDQICASLESSGHMNNFQIYVMMYNGTPDKQQIENVKMALRLKKLSGKSSKTLFCLNKASAHLSKDNLNFMDDYRKSYVKIIRDHIESHPYDEKEETVWSRIKKKSKEVLYSNAYEEIKEINEKMKQYTLQALDDEDFIFTDWEDKKAHEKGIKGPEDVRKIIRKFLVDSKIRSPDNVMDI